MILKRIFIIITLLALLPILFFIFNSYQSDSEYKESTPPQLTADSLKSLVISLLQDEELFAGNVSVTFIDPNHDGLWNKAQITVLNTLIADDSVGPIEYIAIAEKTGNMWKVTHYKSHWKCKRNLLFNDSWTTTACP